MTGERSEDAGKAASTALQVRPAQLAAVLAAVALALVLGATGGSAPSAARADPMTPGHRNGEIPISDLVSVAGVRLAPDAAAAFARMVAAAQRDGVIIAVTDGYRSYDRQVSLKQEKGWLAARPGTSMHGWGIAVDFDMLVTDFAWLRRNAATHGWEHPAWARPGGSKPEPWHWEYVGAAGPPNQLPPPLQPAPDDGELVATARLEPVGGAAGSWFEIREGLDGIEEGPRHYRGTAGPGESGNFAVAGYRRDRGGPLRGLDRLAPGDAVLVRTPAGGEHRYEVAKRAELAPGDGWAVGPDPMKDGTAATMTLTTASDDGGMLVVWCRRTS